MNTKIRGAFGSGYSREERREIKRKFRKKYKINNLTLKKLNTILEQESFGQLYIGEDPSFCNLTRGFDHYDNNIFLDCYPTIADFIEGALNLRDYTYRYDSRFKKDGDYGQCYA